MSEPMDKSMKELIDEHGKEARDRWREVFDESRARGADATEASKVADEVLRLEVERGVHVPCAQNATDRKARSLARTIVNNTDRSGKIIDPEWIEFIVQRAKEIDSGMES
jgi:hypothetical protein